MRAGGQVAAVCSVGLVFVAFGATGLTGPGVAQAMSVGVLVGGTWMVIASLLAGVDHRRGRVVYRGVGTRTAVLQPGGVVELRSSLYLPFLYLHELVVCYPDGSKVALPGASPSSFRSRPGPTARRRQDRLQEWLGTTSSGT